MVFYFPNPPTSQSPRPSQPVTGSARADRWRVKRERVQQTTDQLINRPRLRRAPPRGSEKFQSSVTHPVWLQLDGNNVFSSSSSAADIFHIH